MSKHPTPWKLNESTGFIVDANGVDVCDVWVTDDHETRAVLLHAAEMFAALRMFRDNSSAEGDKWTVALDELTDKIEAEIAKGNP